MKYAAAYAMKFEMNDCALRMLQMCSEDAARALYKTPNIEYAMPVLRITNYAHACGYDLATPVQPSHAMNMLLVPPHIHYDLPQPDGKNALSMRNGFCPVGMVRKCHGCYNSRYYCAIDKLSTCYLNMRSPLCQYAMRVK